jgi:hypothetical protein
MRWRSLLVGAPIVLAGCVATPAFERVSGVTPKTVVDVIQCELATAKASLARRPNPILLQQWTAVAELSLQVDEQATLTPAFTHTGLVGNLLQIDWGLKLDTQASRIYNETVTFAIDKLSAKACEGLSPGITLKGNLGLQEVIEMAFLSVDPNNAGATGPFSAAPAAPGQPSARQFVAPRERGRDAMSAPAPKFARGARGGGKAKTEGAFGTSIEFVIVKGVGPGGPTWTLHNFRGPGSKLFTAQRTDTHKVTISFSKEGEKGAQDQNQSLKLESLNSSIRSLRVAP